MFSFSTEIADTPVWLTERLDQGRAHTGAVTTEREVVLDTPEQVYAATQALDYYVKAGLIPLEGQGSDARVYQTFCNMRDLGVSMEVAVPLVWEKYIEPHALPLGAYDIDWVTSKAQNAYEYAQSSEGVWAPPPLAENFADIIAAQAAEQAVVTERLHSELLPFADFINDNVPPIEDLIDGRLEKHIPNFLAGRGGVHKSRLALQWGMCIANGIDMIEERKCQQATLVYLSSEDDKAEITRRAHAIGRRLAPMTYDNMYLLDRHGKQSALCAVDEGARCAMSPFWDQLVALLKSIPGHKFVVLDSLIDFVAFIGRAKIDDGSVNFFIKNVLTRLCSETDSTLLCIFHSSRSGEATGSGWSVAFDDAPRGRHMMKVSDRDTVELIQTKRNHGKLSDMIEMRFDNGALMPVRMTAADQDGLKAWIIQTAISQALVGVPFQKQGNVGDWVREQAERDFGVKPRHTELKEILEEAVRNKVLRYRNGGGGRPAGYYPWGDAPADAIEGAANSL